MNVTFFQTCGTPLPGCADEGATLGFRCWRRFVEIICWSEVSALNPGVLICDLLIFNPYLLKNLGFSERNTATASSPETGTHRSRRLARSTCRPHRCCDWCRRKLHPVFCVRRSARRPECLRR